MPPKKRKRSLPEAVYKDISSLELATRVMLHTAVYTALNSRGIGLTDEPCAGRSVEYSFSDHSTWPSETRQYRGSSYFFQAKWDTLDTYHYTAACAINLANVISRHFDEINVPKTGSERKVHQLRVEGAVDSRMKMVYQSVSFRVRDADPADVREGVTEAV